MRFMSVETHHITKIEEPDAKGEKSNRSFKS